MRPLSLLLQQELVLRNRKGLRPDDRLTVWLEVSIVCNDDKPFDFCLRDQHAIERVNVMRR